MNWPKRGVQLVARGDPDRVRLEDLRLALGVDLVSAGSPSLGTMWRVRAVVAMFTRRPKSSTNEHVVERVGRLEHPHVDQDLAAAEVELRDQRPS